MRKRENKRRVIFLSLPDGRYPCGVNGGRPTPQRTLLIYGKIKKMSRFKGVKLALKRVKKWMKTRGRILRFEGGFFKENLYLFNKSRKKKNKKVFELKASKHRSFFLSCPKIV